MQNFQNSQKSFVEKGKLLSEKIISFLRNNDFQDISEDGDVLINGNNYSGNISAGCDVSIGRNNTSDDISAGGDVSIGRNNDSNNILACCDISIKGNNSSNDISAGDNVYIGRNNDSGNVLARYDISIKGDNYSYDIISKDGNIFIDGTNQICNKLIAKKGIICIKGDCVSGHLIAKKVNIVGKTYSEVKITILD